MQGYQAKTITRPLCSDLPHCRRDNPLLKLKQSSHLELTLLALFGLVSRGTLKHADNHVNVSHIVCLSLHQPFGLPVVRFPLQSPVEKMRSLGGPFSFPSLCSFVLALVATAMGIYLYETWKKWFFSKGKENFGLWTDFQHVEEHTKPFLEDGL